MLPLQDSSRLCLNLGNVWHDDDVLMQSLCCVVRSLQAQKSRFAQEQPADVAVSSPAVSWAPSLSAVLR